jgi:glucose/mannose-6-phosphate isomerase
MLGLAKAFPEQCAEGLAIGKKADLQGVRAGEVDNIVVAGMGGSAISGDLLAAAFSHELSVPVSVVRGPQIPRFVSPRTLFFATSYSGDTPETLRAFEAAERAGAQIIALGSGGMLAKKAEGALLGLITVPGDQPPRASTGYLFMPMVAVLDRLGLLSAEPDVSEALEILRQQSRELSPEVPSSQNAAKQLAVSLTGRFIFIYASGPMLGPAALRWRTQFNENSKVLAHSQELPELSHNEVEGWNLGADNVRSAAVIFLTTRTSDPIVTAQQGGVADMLGKRGVEVVLYQARGTSPLAQILSSVYMGDFTSIYLGLLNSAEPGRVEAIEALRRIVGGSLGTPAAT